MLRLLGSKTLETLGTKCIRTLLCICWQTMIKTMSLDLFVIVWIKLNVETFCAKLQSLIDQK